MNISTKTIIAVFLLFFFIQEITGKENQYAEYQAGVIVFKISKNINVEKTQNKNYKFDNQEITAFLNELEDPRTERTFPHCLPPKFNQVDLTRIYTLRFSDDFPIPELCASFSVLKDIEYAEPRYIHQLDVEYSDPLSWGQYGLRRVQAKQAHDITTGHKTIPVAIIDTGIDMDHPDLIDNIWVNPGEDLNGDGQIQNNERNRRDDDDNGQIDDFYGWDFVDDDNHPEDEVDIEGYENPGHGTHVAGISAAATNNELGVASIGYNCSIMVVRTGSINIPYGYDGIEYAARTGAQVINCSWGGGGGGRFGQEVVTYAHEQGALVIAAAGNDNRSARHYPSAFSNVVAVAATDSNDLKASFSNYGNWVDLSAPGYQILATTLGRNYGRKSGTSMASPYAAGVAILLRAAYPGLEIEHIEMLLLEGADDIDDINPDYRDELGLGRINALASLNLGPRPVLEVSEMEFISEENENHKFDLGETLEIAFEFRNRGGNPFADSLTAYLSSNDPSIIIEEGEVLIADIRAGRTENNFEDPFRITIADDTIAHTSSLTLIVQSRGRLNAVNEKYEIVLGHPKVLYIDNDGSRNTEEWYLSALETIPVGWERMVVSEDVSPEPEYLSNYEMVIWATGDALNPLDDDHRNAITESFEAGARLLLTGKYIGDDEENHELLENVFGAQHSQDSVLAATVESLPGNRPLPVEMEMFLFGHGGAPDGRVSPSTMIPVNGADSLVVYRYRDPVTGIAGVYRSDRETNSKTIYMGFGLESVSNVRTRRQDVMSELFGWFSIVSSTPLDQNYVPTEFSIISAYPNPFNQQIRINFNLPSHGLVNLKLFDFSGRQVGFSGVSRYYPQGESEVVLNARSIPSGDYLVVFEYNQKMLGKKITLLK